MGGTLPPSLFELHRRSRFARPANFGGSPVISHLRQNVISRSVEFQCREKSTILAKAADRPR